jgi:acyl carrier protein
MHDKVFRVISQVMNVPLEQVNAESSPDTIGSWDSLNHMNLVFALEEEYRVRFTDDHIVSMLDVASIIITLEEVSGGAGNDA